ncbi:MAG: spore coat protein CotJB [Lachnospiraceae bacterium]
MTSKNLCCCAEQIAMAAVPKQEWCEPYDLCTALKEGTIFPCLNLTFYKAPLGESSQKPAGDSPDAAQRNRETAMTRLMEVGFAINDLTLYLDTHPSCAKGLSLFRQLSEERLKLLADFAGDFYPLTQLSMVTGNTDPNEYGWTEGPMPWEGACI